MEKNEEEAGGGDANIKWAKKKSGIHNLKRKYVELKAKFDNVEKTQDDGGICCVTHHKNLSCIN